jgi:hypothetical protein
MMKLVALAIVLAATSTACMTDPDGPTDDVAVFAPGQTAVNHEAGAASTEERRGPIACPLPPAHTEAERTGVVTSAAIDGPQTTELPGDFCDHLPADGACALACDPEKLVEHYVPVGTCVLIQCTLDTGETFKTGGCRPANVDATTERHDGTGGAALE